MRSSRPSDESMPLVLPTSGTSGLETELHLGRLSRWRLRVMFLIALLACAGVAGLTDSLSGQHLLRATWRSNADQRLELVASRDPALEAMRGAVLASITSHAGEIALPDALALQRSSRWITDDQQRAEHPRLHAKLATVLSADQVRLYFTSGERIELALRPRGVLGLPAMYWLFSLLALAVAASGVLLALGRSTLQSWLYATMTGCQAGNLLFIAVQTTADLGLPATLSRLDLPLRQAFDLVTAAAFLHFVSLCPRRLPNSGVIAASGWSFAAAIALLGSNPTFEYSWWTVQLGVALLATAAVVVLGWSHSLEPHPYALLLRRFCIAAVATWLLLTVGVSAAGDLGGPSALVVAIGPAVWYVFLASLLLLAPMLSRSQHVMREFSLLAALSTVVTSLDLLFVSVFSLGPFTSLTLSLFVSLAVYAGARQWILDRLLGNAVLTTERTFEHLYRTVREVERRPERAPALLAQLLRRLFEPVEMRLVDVVSSVATVTSDGGSMTVPLPQLGDESPPRSLLLRFAHHGRHLFTREDARLSERIVEQLERAVRFDNAVEQGRSEERMRLAQDLHDDIGARLLTLMYKSADPEVENYLRHTLQDLKTLTRGLAASSHRLSDAAAEWKADLQTRLAAAGIELAWHSAFDADPILAVGPWSALTRILRELASNALAHARASRIEVSIELAGDRLCLVVSDDGVGRAPAAWDAGLGVGGVRKRVRQLGGEVVWSVNQPSGIRCQVVLPRPDTMNDTAA